MFKHDVGPWALPIAACIGGVASTAFAFLLSQSSEFGKGSVMSLLLTWHCR